MDRAVAAALLAAGVLDEALLSEFGKAPLDGAEGITGSADNVRRIAARVLPNVGKDLLDLFVRRGSRLPLGGWRHQGFRTLFFSRYSIVTADKLCYPFGNLRTGFGFQLKGGGFLLPWHPLHHHHVVLARLDISERH